MKNKLLKRANGGFSLVELIVVIAIMAILVGVAVPVYSSYIEKSQIAADTQLVDEVKHAMQIANAGQILTESAYVILSDVAPSFEDGTISSEELETILKATFGDDLSGLVLKYDGWEGTYEGSSFQGNETVLMNKVDGLTGLLGETLADNPSLVGNNFTNYMNGLGFSADDKANYDKVADAAVLYVADGTSKLTPEQQAQFKQVAVSAINTDAHFAALLNGFSDIYGSNVMGAAATYAMLTAYCQYEDSLAGNTVMMDALGTPDASGVTTGSSSELLEVIESSVIKLDEILEENDGLNFEKYWTEVVATDADAFLNVMSTVTSAKGQIVGNLGESGCFTSQKLQDLFASYGDGGIAILADIQQDGTMVITVIPQV